MIGDGSFSIYRVCGFCIHGENAETQHLPILLMVQYWPLCISSGASLANMNEILYFGPTQWTRRLLWNLWDCRLGDASKNGTDKKIREQKLFAYAASIKSRPKNFLSGLLLQVDVVVRKGSLCLLSEAPVSLEENAAPSAFEELGRNLVFKN